MLLENWLVLEIKRKTPVEAMILVPHIWLALTRFVKLHVITRLVLLEKDALFWITKHCACVHPNANPVFPFAWKIEDVHLMKLVSITNAKIHAKSCRVQETLHVLLKIINLFANFVHLDSLQIPIMDVYKVQPVKNPEADKKLKQ